MISNKTLKIAIADSSTIIRNGIAVTLKCIPGFKILPIEISDAATLQECVSVHKPDILIVHPAFLGYSDVRKFKEETRQVRMKCMALVCAVGDSSLVKNYDDSLTLYDEPELLREKLNKLLNMPENEPESSGQDVLSGREKEIIICVVKGKTNKEIADMLFLSTHTVITHRRNIARKLQIHSSAGLTIYAIVNKLIELQDIKDSLS